MKLKAALLIVTSPVLYAGSPEIPVESPKEDWITPTLNIRSRYEFGDVDALDASHAFTFRERLGFKTMAWNGFSAVVEGEFTQAVIDDYHGGAAGVDPFDPANTTIADPETNELNQLYLQYAGFDTVTKIGRQRLIYDNAAFIGNVGWRQNEQTFDAISFANKSFDNLTLNYAYLSQINRIFGSDADGAPPNVQDVAASVHLINASYTGIQGLTLGSYAYIMNFENLGGWDNNTFGVSAKGKAVGLDLYGELAWQDKAGAAGTEDALYTHLTATKPIGTQSVTLGFEHLDAGFKTPLATVHAFNGFADAFIAGRLGGTHNGLSNLYVAHTLPVFWGMKWTNSLHAMGDNEISTGYGWEIDSVLAKKFNDQFSAIAKLAHFESEGDAFVAAAALPTTTRFTVELNYEF
ncbi:MAG: alginate export family protein [Verrucomicrobiota bacterium]